MLKAQHTNTVAMLVATLSTFIAATFGFTFLYVAAGRLGFDAGVLGLPDDVVRKIAHFTVYGSLAFLLARAMPNWHLLAWLISALLATGEEINQLFVNWRFACITDWALNMAGITTFILLSRFVWPWAFNTLRHVAQHRAARKLQPAPARG